MKKNIKKIEKSIITLLILIIIGIGQYINEENQYQTTGANSKNAYEITNIPEYSGQMYVEINNNNPQFTEEDKNLKEDYYSELEKGRVRNGYSKN